jgi:hypothetical protein
LAHDPERLAPQAHLTDSGESPAGTGHTSRELERAGPSITRRANPSRLLGGYPGQIVWGSKDPARKLAVEGKAARRAAGVDKIHTVPAKHFLQEDQAPAVAQLIARLA